MYELISCDLLNHAECEIYDDLLTAKCTDWICEVEDKLKELENAECATVADVLHPNGGLPHAGLPRHFRIRDSRPVSHGFTGTEFPPIATNSG